MGKLFFFLMATAIAIGWMSGEHAPVPKPEVAVANADSQDKAARAINASASRIEPVGNGHADTRLDRAPDGHFYANLMVNGASIRFLVDTGATTVALSRNDAQAAGLQFSDTEFNERGKAASGEVALKRVSLDRVALGPLEARNVDAVVIDGDVGISLLGQSWLRRVGSVTIEGDRMVLR